MSAMMLALLLFAQLSVPDATRTPGVVRPLSVATICATRWGLDRRHVTVAMRRHVFAAYGVPDAQRKNYELDHDIPRSLGGADDVRNLWPQPWPEAHKKDQLEVKLRTLVCRGQLSLKDAQDAIKTDWVKAYEKFEGRPPF